MSAAAEVKASFMSSSLRWAVYQHGRRSRSTVGEATAPSANHIQCERMDAFLTSDGLLALVTLTFLEIVLGVDNVIFISILARQAAARSSRARRAASGSARRDGHADPAADVDRVDHPADRAALHRARPGDLRPRPDPARSAACSCSARRRSRSTTGSKARKATARRRSRRRFGAVIVQIMLLDIVFSLDSVITAVGMADDLSIMVPPSSSPSAS